MATQQPTPDPLTQAALRSMKDIAVPAPVSWMPQTWGWALLAVLLLSIGAIALLMWLRRYRANAYRREAIVELDRIGEQMNDPANHQAAIQMLAELIKRVALVSYGRSATAALTGSSWVRFIDDHSPTTSLTALAATLDDGEYRGAQEGNGRFAVEGGELIAEAHRWIEHHHVSA